MTSRRVLGRLRQRPTTAHAPLPPPVFPTHGANRSLLRPMGSMPTPSLLLAEILLRMCSASVIFILSAGLGGACKFFRQLAVPYWEALDGKVPAMGRSGADSPHARAIRYHLALNACKAIEPMISHHIEKESYTGCCQNFPGGRWKLDQEIGQENGDDFEYFCRFTRKTDGSVLAQGFTSMSLGDDFSGFRKRKGKSKQLPLREFDLSRWKKMNDLITILDETQGFLGGTLDIDDYIDDFRRRVENALAETMNDLVITIIAVSKEATPVLHVIAAGNERSDLAFSSVCKDGGLFVFQYTGEMKDILIDPHESSHRDAVSTALSLYVRNRGTSHYHSVKLQVNYLLKSNNDNY